MTPERLATFRTCTKRIAVALSVLLPLLYGVCRDLFGGRYIDLAIAAEDVFWGALLLVPVVWVAYGMAVYVLNAFASPVATRQVAVSGTEARPRSAQNPDNTL